MTQIVETEQGMTHIKEHGDEYITLKPFWSVQIQMKKEFIILQLNYLKEKFCKKDKSLELWYEK